MSTQKHELKKMIETATDDNMSIWNITFNTMQEYLIDSGLIDLSRPFVPPTEPKSYSSQNRRNSKKEEIECWHCKQKGHYRHECSSLKKEEATAQTSTEKQSWMVSKTPTKSTFILDSGASQHVCGNKDWFQELHSVTPQRMHTANGIIEYSLEGTVNFQLENGLEVELHDVAFWEGAPSLLSVPTLAQKGVQVLFLKDKAILQKNKAILYTAYHVEGVYTCRIKVQQQQYCMISIKVWHNRLNHCGKEKFQLTMGKELNNNDVTKFYESLCEGCATG